VLKLLEVPGQPGTNKASTQVPFVRANTADFSCILVGFVAIDNQARVLNKGYEVGSSNPPVVLSSFRRVDAGYAEAHHATPSRAYFDRVAVCG